MNGEERVKLVFDNILSAVQLLNETQLNAAGSFRELARVLRRQEDAAWFTDPTTMKATGASDKVESRIKLLYAAANFSDICNDIIRKEAAQKEKE